MSDETAELVGFLSDPRAHAREMAAEGVAAYTATAEGTAALLKCGSGLLAALADLKQ